MDFLDYVKMCQEETTAVPRDNNRRQEQEGIGPAMRTPQMEQRQVERDRMVEGQLQQPQMEDRARCRGQVYKVQRGDTLYSISRRYELRVRDLMQANPFVNVYNLQVGDELCIPVVGGRPETGVRPYVVKKDDTVLSILKQNRISFEELARWNRSAAVLKIPAGTVLLLP